MSGLGQNHHYRKINFDEDGVQILHCGSLNHWVATAIKAYDIDGVVQLIDSAYCCKPTDSMKTSIAQLYSRAQETKYKYLEMQQQQGNIDCGLFAIATAFDILSAQEEITSIVYKQSELRL
eukprot:454024_1